MFVILPLLILYIFFSTFCANGACSNVSWFACVNQPARQSVCSYKPHAYMDYISNRQYTVLPWAWTAFAACETRITNCEMVIKGVKIVGKRKLGWESWKIKLIENSLQFVASLQNVAITQLHTTHAALNTHIYLLYLFICLFTFLSSKNCNCKQHNWQYRQLQTHTRTHASIWQLI